MWPLILASASPQRTKLLEQAGVAHTVRTVDCHEDLDRVEGAEEMVERICRTKLAAALEQFPPELVASHQILCADTLVSNLHHRLGKPADAAEAESYLRMLSGKVHQVLSGVILWTPPSKAGNPGTIEFRHSSSDVRFARLSDADIAWYIASGEWAGAAGAYRIQGKAACLIAAIEGSWTGIVGLPLEIIYQLLSLA